MSVGHSDEVIRTIEMAPHFEFGPHWHDTVQLMWPHAGSMRVACGARSWMLIHGEAIWVPGREIHNALGGSSGCTFRSLYVRDTSRNGAKPHRQGLLGDAHTPRQPVPIVLDRLLLEILDELDGSRELEDSERVLLERVMFDRLRLALRTSTSEGITVALPFPRDDRAAVIAKTILECPNDDRNLDEWGQVVGASGRTLSRLWRNETHLTFQKWRTAARLRRG